MSDGIVKGHVEEAEIGAGRFTVHREPNPSRVPVLLIPDDGSRVVVSREEWERKERAIRLAAQALVEKDVAEAYHQLYWADDGVSKGEHLRTPIVTPEEHGHD